MSEKLPCQEGSFFLNKIDKKANEKFHELKEKIGKAATKDDNENLRKNISKLYIEQIKLYTKQEVTEKSVNDIKDDHNIIMSKGRFKKSS